MKQKFPLISPDKVQQKGEVISSLYHYSYDQNLGPTIKKGDQEIVMMGSVNYLGLAHHPEIVQAALTSIKRNGSGGLGSRYSNGCLDIHFELDEAIKVFFEREDCVVFNSGYMANLGVLSSFGKDALIFSDKENHLSIYDGLHLSRSKYLRFRHNDAEHLRFMLRRNARHKNKWIVLVGTFGATGENIRLKELVSVAKEFDAKIYLDDAHLIGIEGAKKQGLAELESIYNQIDLLMGSFQMAFGNIGAFVAGSKKMVEPIKYFSRPYIFSFTLPAANVSALLAGFKILRSQEGDILVSRLKANSNLLRNGLKDLGFSVMSEDTHIVSVRIGNEKIAAKIANGLFSEGSWVQKYINPSVPKGNALLRFTCMATHQEKHIVHVLDSMKKN